MKNIFFISILLLVFYQHIIAQECPENVIISGTYQVPYTGSHTWISSSGETKIPAGANVVLDANPIKDGYIRLDTGFLAMPGAVFKAVVITPCALSEKNNLSKNNLSKNNLSIESQIQIFPNPNDGNFNVELPNEAEQGLRFRINDFTGRLMQEKSIETGIKLQSVEAQQLPEGLYFLQIVSEGKILAVKKFVKQ